tara:strand:- start:559 stop:753 length:195 start_codon:yes stop_codon:yes gene_type:complete
LHIGREINFLRRHYPVQVLGLRKSFLSFLKSTPVKNIVSRSYIYLKTIIYFSKNIVNLSDHENN